MTKSYRDRLLELDLLDLVRSSSFLALDNVTRKKLTGWAYLLTKHRLPQALKCYNAAQRSNEPTLIKKYTDNYNLVLQQIKAHKERVVDAILASLYTQSNSDDSKGSLE